MARARLNIGLSASIQKDCQGSGKQKFAVGRLGATNAANCCTSADYIVVKSFTTNTIRTLRCWCESAVGSARETFNHAKPPVSSSNQIPLHCLLGLTVRT